jgi:hypothetical protein
MRTGNLYLYSDSEIASNALNAFYEEVYGAYDENLTEKFINVNNEVFSLISKLTLNKFFISTTSSESLFYRFSIVDKPFEFMWEVFLDYDGEQNIGSTLHIFNADNKVLSTFGDTTYIFDKIIEIAFQGQETNQSVFEMQVIDEYEAVYA